MIRKWTYLTYFKKRKRKKRSGDYKKKKKRSGDYKKRKKKKSADYRRRGQETIYK